MGRCRTEIEGVDEHRPERPPAGHPELIVVGGNTVDLHPPVELDDGEHPNAERSRVIAEALHAALQGADQEGCG